MGPTSIPIKLLKFIPDLIIRGMWYYLALGGWIVERHGVIIETFLETVTRTR